MIKLKEKFREWIPKGTIKVKWKDKQTGEIGYWIQDAKELFSWVDTIVNQFQGYKIRLTNRQLYYQLVGKDWIPNKMEVYKRICTFITDCRYGGLIDWEAIEDKGRTPTMHIEFEDIKERIEVALYNFRLKRWSNQHYYVELYCEKQAGETVLKPIAEQYHIYFGYNKGYNSAGSMYELSKRIAEKIEEGKEVRILYFGDHDPSGLDMVRDIKDRITEFLEEGQDYIEPNFEVIPIALSEEQIKKYKCPPNPAKFSDPRAKKYIEKFGEISWELDSLNPLVLRKLAENGIREFCDIDKYNAWIEREKEESKLLTQFAEKIVKDS